MLWRLLKNVRNLKFIRYQIPNPIKLITSNFLFKKIELDSFVYIYIKIDTCNQTPQLLS